MNFLWLIKSESYKKGLILSVVFNIIAKGALFLLTICIAGFFGSNIRTDIYFFVYGTVLLLSAFVNTIDTMVLIPESMRIRQQEGSDAAVSFLNYFFRMYLLIAVLFTAIMLLGGTSLIGYFSKFSATDILTYKNYFLLGSLFFSFQVLTGYMNAILTSLRFFSIPMLISGLNSCMVIAGIILLHGQYDVMSVLIGGLVAYAINFILLVLLMKKLAGWNFMHSTPGIKKKVWHNIGFAQLGQLATLASSFFPLFLLSGFGKGVISVMNYGKNIADIPNTLVTSQLANVSGIKLNEQVAQHDLPGLNDTFLRTSRLLVFILIPVSCYLFLFAEPITRLFYKRGSFTEAEVVDAAGFMRLLSVTLFSIGINAIVSRIFIALQAIRQAFVYQVILNLFLIAAIWGFSRYYGAYGYPYGIILMNGVNFIAMYVVCKKLTREINYGNILGYTAKLLLINLAISTGLYFVAAYFPIGLLPGLLIPFLIYLVLLLLLNNIFHLNTEFHDFIKQLKEKFA